MAVQFSVSVGGIFKPIKKAWVSVGGVFQEIKTIKGSVGGAFQLLYDYAHVIASGFAYNDLDSSPTTAVAYVQFNSDGTATDSNGATDNWFIPTTAGAGTGRYVILIPLTTNGGTEGGGARNTRIQLSTNPFFNLSSSTIGSHDRSYTVQFWDAPSGGNMLSSGTMHLYLEVF